MILKQHLSKEKGLSDLLNYAHFIEDGVLLNKDGAYLITYKFKGQDIHSSTTGELDALTANFNRMFTFLEDGWMIHVDEIRVPSINYPEEGHFPDSVSRLIDEERRQLYEAEGGHYENLQFITFVWKFPLPTVKTTRHLFVEGLASDEGKESLTTLLNTFIETVERCTALISSQMTLEKLTSRDMLSFLNTAISGELLPVTPPPDGCYVDIVLGRQEVIGGYVPKIGNKHVYVLALSGYLNDATVPGLLDELGSYPLVYRWSNRFVPLSERTAAKEINRYTKNWNNKLKGIIGIVKEAFFGKQQQDDGKINKDTLSMSAETQEAVAANSSRSTCFGYWTSNIVLMNEELDVLQNATKEIANYLQQKGFSCYKESVNAFDAWLGTVPGHGSCNIRRVFLNSINLAHILPLNTIWTGGAASPGASLLPKNSPPVFYAATTGKTPFRYHMDVGDVGHQLILGPTGAGKSTFLGFLISQFFRYPNAKIFVFDKDYSHQALTAALGGNHYDIGNADELAFCPLGDLSTESKRVRAEQFIEDLVSLQNVTITPSIKSAIHTAIQALCRDDHVKSRNLTIFQSVVQHADVREALQYYTIEGRIKLLDATQDSMKQGKLQTFETGWLLNQKPEVYLPVLRHIFDQIDSHLEEADGKEPTLITLEEAWKPISHPMFANEIIDRLKTLRKKNGRLVLVTHSLTDLYDPATARLTSVTAAIMESCFTKVYLPNPSAEANVLDLYRMMNLNERQIEIITQIALPKRHYYVVSHEGNRLIDLGFNDNSTLALNFIGLSKEKSGELLECKKTFGEAWVYHWLTKNNFQGWGDYWKANYFQGNHL